MKTHLLRSTIFVLLTAFAVAAAPTSVAPGHKALYSMGDREYVSSTILEFIIPRVDIDLLQEERLKAGREFIDEQRNEILSDENLKRAIEKLIPGVGEDKNAFFEQAKNGLSVINIEGTDLFRITVKFHDKEFARDLANRLAGLYLETNKPQGDEKGPIIHQKAIIGVPNDKKE